METAPGADYNLTVKGKWATRWDRQGLYRDEQYLGSTPPQPCADSHLPQQGQGPGLFPIRPEKGRKWRSPRPPWGPQTNAAHFNKSNLLISNGPLEGRKVRRLKIIYLVRFKEWKCIYGFHPTIPWTIKMKSTFMSFCFTWCILLCICWTPDAFSRAFLSKKAEFSVYSGFQNCYLLLHYSVFSFQRTMIVNLLLRVS